ncbi:DUF302 domain-containing protein [Nocardioides sp. YJ-D4]
MTSFTLSATIPASYAETLARVRDLLGDAGFGVLTEIDLAATLHAKLGVDIPQQVVLGACRPQLAHRALEADPRIATMLPCNVVVAAEGEETRVEIFDPAAMTSFSSDVGVAEVAADARQRLTGMLEALTEEKKDDHAARA